MGIHLFFCQFYNENNGHFFIFFNENNDKLFEKDQMFEKIILFHCMNFK